MRLNLAEMVDPSANVPPTVSEHEGTPRSRARDARRRKRAIWQPRAASLRARTLIVFLLTDLSCIILSFAAASAVRGAFLDTSWIVLVALLIPLFIAVAANGGGYNTGNLREPLRAVSVGVRALALALTILLLAAYYLKASATLPRLTVALGSFASFATMTFFRFHIARNLESIVGGDPYSVALIREAGQPIPPRTFSVTITADDFLDPHRHDPLMYDRLANALKGVNNVVVSCHPDRRLAWTHALKGANIQSEILMPELEMFAPMGANSHGGMTSIVVARGPLNLADRALKRGFDLAVASGALLMLMPLLVATAIAIKLESSGPLFFRQTRIGRGNEVFRVFKFRSMRVALLDAEGHRSTSRDDDRITRVGRFIRSTSIDELPQLLNVLAGSMSIVGPRPHALGSRAADKLFWEVDGRYWHRHAAKPGLTGLAQVRGYRGATVEEKDLRDRLQADLEYLDTWSIWRDLKIIFMTFQVIVHRNAY